jgi:hypothetical protein
MRSWDHHLIGGGWSSPAAQTILCINSLTFLIFSVSLCASCWESIGRSTDTPPTMSLVRRFRPTVQSHFDWSCTQSR